jgi:hypothetical protein
VSVLPDAIVIAGCCIALDEVLDFQIAWKPGSLDFSIVFGDYLVT